MINFDEMSKKEKLDYIQDKVLTNLCVQFSEGVATPRQVEVASMFLKNNNMTEEKETEAGMHDIVKELLNDKK